MFSCQGIYFQEKEKTFMKKSILLTSYIATRSWAETLVPAGLVVVAAVVEVVAAASC